MSDDAEWIKVASTTDLEDNTGYESDVEIDGQNVGVFKIDGRFFALGNCPHEQGPLSQGIIESGRITCPWLYFYDDTYKINPPADKLQLNFRRWAWPYFSILPR